MLAAQTFFHAVRQDKRWAGMGPLKYGTDNGSSPQVQLAKVVEDIPSSPKSSGSIILVFSIGQPKDAEEGTTLQ